MIDINLYKQEVKELTNLLLTEWHDIRNIALSKDLNLNANFYWALLKPKKMRNLVCFIIAKKDYCCLKKL